MRIWIDITNAPHINFFREFIEEWKDVHELIITTRPLSNTIDLLVKNNIEHSIVGAHYGKRKISKILGFFKRSKLLIKFLKDKKVDLAISQSSFYSPYVASKLKTKCIYTNDNEFAKGNYFGFFYADHVLLPEALKKWASKKFFFKRTAFYPGVKEGIYTKKSNKQQKSSKIPNLYFRPEPWHAQYLDFNKGTFDRMLKSLSVENKITILPRDKFQSEHFTNLENKNIIVLKGVKSVNEIAEDCDLFLGAGGSMTREFAIMGISTISLYQGSLLEVDKYLIQNKVLHSMKPNEVTIETISNLIKNSQILQKNCDLVLQQGLEARKIINDLVEHLST